MSYVFTPDAGHNKVSYPGLEASYEAIFKGDGTFTLTDGRTRSTFQRTRDMFIGEVPTAEATNVSFMIPINGKDTIISGTLKMVDSPELRGLRGGRRSRRTRSRSRTRRNRNRNRRARTRSRK